MKNLEFSVILVVSGGAAAKQLPELIPLFSKELNTSIPVILTQNACKIVDAKSFRKFSPLVLTEENIHNYFEVPHIELRSKAKILAVVPATANIIGKAAAGIADDLVSTLILSFGEEVLFAPSMNQQMWLNRIVQQNIIKLVSLQRKVIPPAFGKEIADGSITYGAMAHPSLIVSAIKKYLIDN